MTCRIQPVNEPSLYGQFFRRSDLRPGGRPGGQQGGPPGDLIGRICRRLLAVAAAWLLMTGQVTLARDGDLSQPVDVRADTSEYDEQNATQSLSGNVEISQGSLRIEADRIDVFLEDNQLARIAGSGKPIRFEQENNAGELVKGTARTIDYDATSGVLELSGGATLQQPRQTLKSERIVFDARRQTVSAQGNASGERVNIRIEPPPDARERVEQKIDQQRSDDETR